MSKLSEQVAELEQLAQTRSSPHQTVGAFSRPRTHERTT